LSAPPIPRQRSLTGVDRPVACDVSVVFPCLNEAESVGRCVCEARRRLAEAGLSGEVVVCDNGSRDGSGPIAAGAGARVVREERRGYGAAIAGGVRAARGACIV